MLQQDVSWSKKLRVVNIILMVDVSSGMSDKKIYDINCALNELRYILLGYKSDSEYEVKISIMTVDKDAKWSVYATPIEDYYFEPIECGNVGIFDYANAFKELNTKLSTNGLFPKGNKYLAPHIFLFTDSNPVNGSEFVNELNRLQENEFFLGSFRYIVSSNDSLSTSTKDMLKKFAFNPNEDFISVEDVSECLSNLGRTISISHIRKTNSDSEMLDPFPDLPFMHDSNFF